MHVLLNNREALELGKVVQEFADFATELPPDMRGLALSNSLEIRQIHNNFGNLEDQLAFGDEDEEDTKDKKSDPFHFVAFIRSEGKIYELDGLKDAPICHGEASESSWQEGVLEILKKRVEVIVTGSSEIRFNLMSIIGDRRQLLAKRICGLEAEISRNADPNSHLQAKLFDLQAQLEQENSKRDAYKREAAERKKTFAEMQTKRIEMQPPSTSTKLSPQVQTLLEQLKAKGLYKF